MRFHKQFLIVFLFLIINSVFSQLTFVNLNQEYNRNIEMAVYSSSHHFHSSIRPYYVPELQNITNYDSITKLYWMHKEFNKKWKQKTWDKIFNDDVVTLRRKDFEIVANPLMNFNVGRTSPFKGSGGAGTTWTNTRGVEVKGRIGDNVTFYTNFHENQAVFPEYLDTYIRKNSIIPGQGMYKLFGDDGFDYATATGYVSLRAGKYFNFQLGHGKNFYGDGYRSLLLSDNSFNNAFFKISTNVWHIKYEVLYNQYIDIRDKVSYDIGYSRKYTTTHYLSWAISKRVNLSFFDAIIWQATDSAGNYRGFDLQYLNPIIFMRPVEFSVGSPDNAMLGLNLSVIVGKHNVVYGQLVLDEFTFKEVVAGDGYWANKQSFQLGFKTYDPFSIKNLYLQTEFNWVPPYMYSHKTPLKNYGHYNQPLAHPYGANFWESVNFIRYNYKRFFFNYQFIYSIYGEDPEGLNYGKDIYKSYTTRVSDYGNFIGQGIETRLLYNDINVSYLINPSYNLNFTIGYINRNLKTDTDTHTTNYFYIGLKTSIGNTYYDF